MEGFIVSRVNLSFGSFKKYTTFLDRHALYFILNTLYPILKNMPCYFLNLIFENYPDFNYQQSDIFSWYQAERRICFIECTNNCTKGGSPCLNFYKLAHELGHAKLNHQDYLTKIELNRMELGAWREAKIISKKLTKTNIPEEIISSAMESYISHAESDVCKYCDLSLVAGHCINCKS